MSEKRYNTYCDQNENRTVLDDDLNNTHIFIAYCRDLDEAIRLKTALNIVRDELNALHRENESFKQKVKETLQKHYNQTLNSHYADFTLLLADELGIELEELE